MRSRQNVPGDSPEELTAEHEFSAASREADDEQEMEAATELLGITNELELDQFVGRLLQRAAKKIGSPIPHPILQPLTRSLKAALKHTLPIVGKPSQAALAAGKGNAAARSLAAADAFGFELEGLSLEDQEFEIARRFVRFARSVGHRVPRFARRVAPRLAARRALISAARRFAPGLLRRRRRRRRPILYRPRRFGVPAPVLYPDPEPLLDPAAVAAPEPDAAVQLDPDTDPNTDPEPNPDTDGGADPTAEPAQDPEPATDELSSKPSNCHCGGRCGGRRSRSGRWTREGANIVLRDIQSTHQPSQITEKGIIMHDLNRTTLEIGEESDEFEFPEEFEFEQQESPFNEVEEEELAAQLLEVTDEAELDQFLGGLIKKVSKAARGVIKSPLGRQLGGYLKGAIKKALPIAGSAIGGAIAPGVGSSIGAKLATSAGQMFGLELESLGEEEQEFEIARRLVRLAGTAVQNATQEEADKGDPQATAKAAVVAAAQTHAPGLVRPSTGTTAAPRRRASGRWYRQGGRIVIVGA